MRQGALKFEYIEEYIKESLLAYTYYVEYHLSYKDCAKEMLLSPSTVKNRLIGLEAIDEHKFKEYKEEVKRRQGHR